jgi:hypothetical protein
MKLLLWLGSWDFRVGLLLQASLSGVAANSSQLFADRSAAHFAAAKYLPYFNPFESQHNQQ